jgi:Ca-activated chloride channel family protein
MNKIARSFLAAIGASILIICVTLAFSKGSVETGKIKATIVDSTNTPLLHASIQILETKQGAFSKENGIATIINVAPGTYTVIAKYAGFKPLTIKDVKVISGQTTQLTCKLVSKSQDTIVILNDRLVDNTKVDISSKFSGSEIRTVDPVWNIRDVASLSPGVIADGSNGGFAIHGNRGTQNSESMSQTSISNFSISEIDIANRGSNCYGYRYPISGNTAEYKKIEENGYKDVRLEPLSTLSIDVDGASYSNIRRFITAGQAPPADAVRIEEMVNYFKYSYPQPTDGHPFSITTELTECPWNKEHKLALIGLQGKEIPKPEAPSANLTFLIDVSGSMMPEERLPLIKRAFKLLVNELRPQDKVALVTYAGEPGLVLRPTSGEHKDTILQALDRLESGGSTAGGAGLELAYKVAEEIYDKAKNNRVILATDGDFNVGISNTADLVAFIEKKRETGIYLTTIGVGDDNYKDARMKELADKGNGNYYYIDNILEAKKVFVTQMGGTLNTIAKDVKIQIEFNPAQVQGYRLIGYESRILMKEDFNNDKKDAGELGSGHTVTALYEIIPPGQKSDELPSVDSLKYQPNPNPKVNYSGDEVMTVKFRYKKPSEDKSILIEHPVIQTASHFEEASTNLRFAASVTEFGMLLRGSKFKGSAKVSDALALARSSKSEDNEGYRAEFIKLIEAYQLMDKAE